MKMYKVILVLAVCISLSAAVCSADDRMKIGVVDFNQILNESGIGKTTQGEINKKGQALKAELEKAQSDIKSFQDKARREGPLLDDDQKKEIERQMRGKLNEFRMLQEKHTSEFNAFKNQQISRVKQSVVKLAEKIGKQKGYQMIIERQSGAVLYAASSTNLTDRFMEAIDTVKP